MRELLLIYLLIAIAPFVLFVIMIVKYFQIAKDIRIIKKHTAPIGDFTTLQAAVLGDKKATKKLLLVDFHQTVGALADNKQLSIRGFERSYKLFLKEAEEAGVYFTEDELARISDFKLFKRLYKCC